MNMHIYPFKSIVVLMVYLSARQVNPFGQTVNTTSKQQALYLKDINVRLDLYDRKVVQLQIDWTDNLPQGSLYDVIVTAIDPLQCYENPCSVYGATAPSHMLTIPENAESYVADRECNFMLGCNYTLTVENSKVPVATPINISIPSCLFDTCSCSHAEYLPEISMITQVPKHDMIAIEWFLHITNSTQFDNKSHICIRISEQTNPSLSWGGKLLSIVDGVIPLDISQNTCPLDPTTCTLKGWHEFSVQPHLRPQATLTLHAFLLDQYNCSGPELLLEFQVPSFETTVDDHSGPLDNASLWTIVIGVVLCLFAIMGLIYRRRNTLHMEETKISLPTLLEMQENVNYVDKDIEVALLKGLADFYEVPHHGIKLGPEIGQGAFGRVFKATALNLHHTTGSTVVAVKQLKSNCSSEEASEFLSEIEMLKSVGEHDNIVSMLGCCTVRLPYLMIMEYVGRGDLLSYLRDVRLKRQTIIAGNPGTNVKYIELNVTSTTCSNSIDSESNARQQKPSVTETLYTTINDDEFDMVIDHKELENFALQIANGMQFLEAQQIVHRDLAARNVLIDDNKILKISDFGLSRHGIYTNTRTRKLPLRWMSLEAIQDRIYTNKSDVWSYGVVLWEIGTLGASPYATISNHELIPYLLAGHRLDKPEICTDHMYALMHQCWDQDVESRPTFQELYTILLPRSLYVDLNSISNDYVFPPIQNPDN